MAATLPTVVEKENGRTINKAIYNFLTWRLLYRDIFCIQYAFQ